MTDLAPLRVLVSASSYPGDEDAGCALWQADLVRGDSSPLVTLSLIQALEERAKPWVIASEVHGLQVGRNVARAWHSQRGRAGDCILAEALERKPRADFEQTVRYTAGEALRLLRSSALHVALDEGEGRTGWVSRLSSSGRFGLASPLTVNERLPLADEIGSTHGGLKVVV